ncbi:MAG TPA: FAD-dependent oxidoreductase, partial [Roseiarcus sp.]|nr:FAD-dependent oxidoreductase [Roseiarcus sp.]
MDGQRVKQWEARCIEEQPPACLVACPLRVDARAMIEKIKAGDFAGATAVYARSVPLPAVLSRICDHPCEAACRRAEAGGAIRIAALERASVGEAYATIRRSPQPARKPKRVAIVGAGIAGLTAAFDLAMKGRAVTVFEAEDRPLPRLAARRPDLPSSAVDADVAALATLGVAIQCNTRIGAVGRPTLSSLIADHDAVLVATGASPSWTLAADLELDADGAMVVDLETRLASNPKVFGKGARSAYSPIGSAADGRRAALSIDRFLQGASLTANRTDESSGSCLYVNVAAHAPVPPVASLDPRGYAHDEAIAEAARCFPCRCLECVKACEYLRCYGAY